MGVIGTANGGFCGTVQLPADELDDDAADELGDGAAQLVSEELRERGFGRSGLSEEPVR